MQSIDVLCFQQSTLRRAVMNTRGHRRVKIPLSLHFTTHPQADQDIHFPPSGNRTEVVIRPISFPRWVPLTTDRIVRLSHCRGVSLRLGYWDLGGRPFRAQSDFGRTVFSQRASGGGVAFGNACIDS